MLEVVPKQVSWVLSASITMFRRASNMGICGYSKYRLAKNSCTACVAQWYLQKVQTTQKSQYPCVIYKLQTQVLVPLCHLQTTDRSFRSLVPMSFACSRLKSTASALFTNQKLRLKILVSLFFFLNYTIQGLDIISTTATQWSLCSFPNILIIGL